MIITDNDRAKLIVDKAKKCSVARGVLRNYCKLCALNLEGASINIKKDIEPGIYAARIEMTSSGNEARVYGFVYDNNGDILASANKLSADPAAYADVARYCGAFMEAFNMYTDLNDLY